MKARRRSGVPRPYAAWAALLVAAAATALLVWPIAAFAEGSGSAPEVTRAQWIHELVETFDVTVEDESYPEDYFSDVSEDSPYYGDLVKAVEFGIVDVPAGGAVDADAAATRDFAAHTLNFCLGYQTRADAYAFSDAASCEHPDDDQVAVGRGWLAPVGGKFLPARAVTAVERDAAFADAREVWASTDLEEGHQNVVEFNSGVKVVPGSMATGWADVDDAYKRYFDDEGHMVTGWKTIDGKRYYFRSSGAMQTGEATIEGKSYSFSDKGVLMT